MPFKNYLLLIMLGCTSCRAQNASPMKESSNPLICDTTSGICGLPDSSNEAKKAIKLQGKKLQLIYFTDPICSSCWAIEPQLRRLKLEYGKEIEIHYHMGGLLPDWSYNSGGISKPSDVAAHWDEVSLYYDMPIDGDVWLEDPLPSSYPPSIAFKAAQLQDEEKALHFLRILREMVFLQKKNICRPEQLSAAARQAGLDMAQWEKDNSGRAKTLFEADLNLVKKQGLRGFPSIFILDEKAEQTIIYGSKAYSAYEGALLKLRPAAIKATYDHSPEGLFAQFPSLSAREYAELSGIARNECENILNSLTEKGFLQKENCKNGAIWRRKER